MKFCFIMPRSQFQPVGGYKIVYEYANRLTERGHSVCILYLNSRFLKKYHLPLVVRKVLLNSITRVEPHWFNLSSKVIKISDFEKNFEEKLEGIDVAVATGISTVSYVVEHFSDINKGYLIQDFENWIHSDDYVFNTYSLGLKNIVVSNWLKKLVDQFSDQPSVLIGNPIDINIYKVKVPYKEREKYSIGVLYHPGEYKGFKYTLEALKIVKNKYPSIIIKAFGSFKKPNDFPKWIEYSRNLSQMETVNFYNSIRIFVCGSIEEGFGLTGYESLACGCALISSDYKGVHEYAVDGQNAILSPIKDVNTMAENIARVLNDEDLGCELGQNGVDSVKNNSWDNAVSTFINSFEKL